MSKIRAGVFVAKIIKDNRNTINNETYTVDREEELKLMSCSIYNNKPELIYHCKDVINMVTPIGTSKRRKDIYLKKALVMSEYFKYKDRYDIGRINKYIQHEVNTSLNNLRLIQEQYTFNLNNQRIN